MDDRELSVGIKGVGWIGAVSDEPATRTFCRDVLGLEAIEESAQYAYFGVDDVARLEILATGSAQAERCGDGFTIGFLVADLDAAVAKLQAKGVFPLGPPEEWSSDSPRHRWAYFADPDGRPFLLLERGPGSAR